ncbi:MAG: cell division protein FtsQ/DivIB, partial [Gammaproteobacteria bacterium]
MKQHSPNTLDKHRKWRLVGLGVAGLLVLATLVALVLRFATPALNGPAVTTLIVQGELQHVSPATVRESVLPAVTGHGFFRIDMQALQATVQALPWVAVATVRRSWPHTLYISLVEEVPVARWNADGLLDAQGKVFVHGDVSAYAALPLLSGPEGSAQDVLADYDAFAALTRARGLTIAQLTLDARGAASVRLSDGIEVRLGREAAQQRLERFGAVALPALGAQLSSVAYVDMRYTNGFAVGWLSPAASSACRGHTGPGAQHVKNGSNTVCTQTSAIRDAKRGEVRPD